MNEQTKYYCKKELQPLFPWTPDLPMSLVSVSEADKENGSPKKGDMIAYNPKEPTDFWLVAEKFFIDNYIFVKEQDNAELTELERLEKAVVDTITTTFAAEDAAYAAYMTIKDTAWDAAWIAYAEDAAWDAFYTMSDPAYAFYKGVSEAASAYEAKARQELRDYLKEQQDNE